MKEGKFAVGRFGILLLMTTFVAFTLGQSRVAADVATDAGVQAQKNARATRMLLSEKKPVQTPSLTFQVMSDIHLTSDRAEQKFKNALDDLHHASPLSDALVINGDLGNGMPDHYEALKKIMGSKVHPALVYYTIGNHEFYKAWINRHGEWSNDTFPNGETAKASIGRFLRLTGESLVYYDRWLKGYHFIFLGSELYRQTDPGAGDDAFLSKMQLAWLEKKLAENEPVRRNKGKIEGGGDLKDNARLHASKPVFVFLHQPLPGTVSGSDTANYRGVVQHKEITAILAKYPNAILFSGHTHWELKLPAMLVRRTFTMVNSSSVYEPWTTGDMPIPHIRGRSEALEVEVYRDRVHIRGRDIRGHRWIPEADHIVNATGRGAPRTAPIGRAKTGMGDHLRIWSLAIYPFGP